MNEISVEVKARETHENAITNFKISEQYGYKFIMEVKKIRDERYYKQLGFETFEDYCQRSWGFGRNWVNKKIQTASNMNERDFGYFNTQIGSQKTFLLATMETEQREEATEKGIPTEQGYKPLEEATQKEISFYKKDKEEAERRAKEAEQRAEQAERIAENEKRAREQAEQIEPKIIKKEIIKEVVPEHIKKDLETTKRIMNMTSEENKKLQDELDKYTLKDADEFDEEKAEKELKKLQWEAERSVYRFINKVDSFTKEISVFGYMDGEIAASSNKTKERLSQSIATLKSFTRKMETSLNGRIEI